ncbi:MAG: hypothetical protein FP814_09815, partial [Desulfobacterium sp.]|nr:hypothetical protein [Desulfobacterium sp.]
MSDLRTSIILNMTGNLGTQSRRFGRDLENMGHRGARAIGLMNRGITSMTNGLSRLGNRYTGFLFGAGAAGTIRMVGNLESRFTRLGIQANKSAEDMEALKKQIFEISNLPEIRIDPSQLTAAIEEIVEKTGDLDFAKANLKNFAAAIQATGGEGVSIGGIAAEFQKMGLKDPKDVLEALDILSKQGKSGAFTLQNLAALGPRVVTAYTSTGRTGLPAIREMGAALQVIRQGTGSSEMAATAFEALIRTLGDSDKVKMLKKGGIKIFDAEELKKGREILRPINELMVEIIQKTKGKKTLLSKVFDAEAMRAFNAAAAEYQQTGVVSSLQTFYNIQADGTTVMKDSARAAKDFNSALTGITTEGQKFAEKELGGKIKKVADELNSLGSDTVQKWMRVSEAVVAAVGALSLAAKIGGVPGVLV